MIATAHPLRALKDEAIRWKSVDREDGQPCTAAPFLQSGDEWAPLVGIGRRRLSFRAFRVQVEDGKPIRATVKQAPYMVVPLAIHWPEADDAPPEGLCQIPGLDGWWLLHAEVMPY